MRRLAIIGAVWMACWATSAQAQSGGGSCLDAIDAAGTADQSWWEKGGAPAMHYIDGANIGSLDELGKALIAAKQKTPIVVGGNFAGWDFGKSQVGYSGVCFYESDLSRSNWDDADIFGIGFIKSNLSAASFANARLEHALLRELNLNGTLMMAAKLNKGLLDGGWDGDLTNWDLTGADMTGFKFECAITVGDGCALDRAGVKFSGAILTDADISTLPFWGQADYYGANLKGTIIAPRQLADLKGANFNGANIVRGGDSEVRVSRDELSTLVNEAIKGAADADRPSFDCGRAVSIVEKVICGTDGSALRAQDRRLAELYGYIRPKNAGIATSQKAWIATRAKCRDTECIAKQYDERIDALSKLLGEVEIIPRGEEALFIDWEVPFPNSFVDTPLFAKVTPAIVGSSMTELVLNRSSNGSYLAWGSAVGGNAHLCSLEADGMRYDAKSGWFGVGQGKDFAAVLRLLGDEVEIVGSGHPGERYPGSDQYVSCGARAMFGPMRRIKVDAATLKREKEALATGFGE